MIFKYDNINTNIPTNILYTAKTFIGFFFKNPMNLSTTTSATKNEIINPIASPII